MLFYLISQRVPLFLFTPGETHTEEPRDLAKVTQTANSVLGFRSKPIQLQQAHDRGKEQDSHSRRTAPKHEKSGLGAGVGWEVESYRGGAETEKEATRAALRSHSAQSDRRQGGWSAPCPEERQQNGSGSPAVTRETSGIQLCSQRPFSTLSPCFWLLPTRVVQATMVWCGGDQSVLPQHPPRVVPSQSGRRWPDLQPPFSCKHCQLYIACHCFSSLGNGDN